MTWRESLRDIEVCLTSNQTKLFHMGIKSVPARSTLADALNFRDWRIYHALAMRLIANARELYVKEPMSVDLDATVYALDSTTIDLCLSLFDWAPFRSTKATVKMHTLLDLRGAIPAFIHVSDGKLALIGLVFGYRGLAYLKGTPITHWPRGVRHADDPALLHRIEDAHANCLENLPLFAVLVLVAAAMAKLPAINALAACVLYCRVGQSLAHLWGTGSMLVHVRAALWAGQLALFVMIFAKLLAS